MAKILVVDDDPDSCHFYQSLLSAFGHEVFAAEDGEEALATARQHGPALVISDILMPTMNGYEFVSRLRQIPALQTVPVIFRSAGFLDHETQALGQACGVSLFLRKPCEPEEILTTVHRELDLPPYSSIPLQMPEAPNDPVPMLLDAFYAKGKQLDAVSARLAALLELDLQLLHSSDAELLLDGAASAARKIVGSNYAGAGTVDDGVAGRHSFIANGIYKDIAGRMRGEDLEGDLREIAVQGKTIRKFSHVGEPDLLILPAAHPPVRAFLGVPIQTGARIYGVIYVADKLSGLPFTHEDERVLATIAAKLAIVYENAVRYLEIKERAAELENEVVQRKQAQDHLRLLIEGAPNGILVCDADGHITEANSALQKMFGYKRTELIGEPIEMLVPEQHRAAHCSHQKSYLEHPQARLMGFGVEPFGRRKDGTTFPVEIHLAPLKLDKGTWISSSVVDISERKKQEQRLQLSQRLESVGQLAAGIAHDFNNILTAIRGNAKLARAELAEDHPAQLNLAEIQKGSLRATQLVSRILIFGRQEAPRLQLVKLAPLVEEALKLVRVALRAAIEIRTHFDPGLPDVFADSTQIHQIVINLATNAGDAMGTQKSGVLEVSLAEVMVGAPLVLVIPELHEASYVRLSMMDTGGGMDDATMARIFEPFYTTKPQGQGTGLGLSVVHGIMKIHGGAVVVYSEVGKGTIFHLYLPAAQERAPEAAAQPLQEEFRGHGERVLYVDDEEAMVFLMTRMLHQLGYVVTCRTDAGEALETFRSRPGEFDVVVSDLSMPKLSGLDLAREMLEIRPGMPILVVSGYVSADDNAEARSLGLPELILKPDTIEEMGEILHKVFARLETGGKALSAYRPTL